MSSGYVYELHEPGGPPRYVGATTRPVERRLHGHRQAAREDKPWPVAQWVREVGDYGFEASVLEVNPEEPLEDAEAYWIARIRSDGHALLNRTIGYAGGFCRFGPRPPARPRGKPHTKRHEFKDPARQADSGTRGAHNRWHVARGVTNPDCAFCAV